MREPAGMRYWNGSMGAIPQAQRLTASRNAERLQQWDPRLHDAQPLAVDLPAALARDWSGSCCRLPGIYRLRKGFFSAATRGSLPRRRRHCSFTPWRWPRRAASGGNYSPALRADFIIPGWKGGGCQLIDSALLQLRGFQATVGGLCLQSHPRPQARHMGRMTWNTWGNWPESPAALAPGTQNLLRQA